MPVTKLVSHGVQMHRRSKRFFEKATDKGEIRMPILKQIRTDRRRKESCYLLDFQFDVTSQCGEDGILRELFKRIGANNQWCVEFGAWDGKKYSNTYNLIANEQWFGVLIEGSPVKYEELLATYGQNPRAHCLCGIVNHSSGAGSLDSHLATTPIPKDFDLLSIDIDGNDYHVWDSLQEYKPRVVVIEYNPTVPDDVIFIQDKGLEINQGCSLRSLVELGKSKGYELAAVTPLNGIFVAASEFQKLGIVDNSLDAMSYTATDAKCFDCYDGTMYHVGFNKLHWVKGVTWAADQIQVLDAAKRTWADGIATGQKK
jgi:hypothetical protein